VLRPQPASGSSSPFPAGNANEPGDALRQSLLDLGVEIIEAGTVVDVLRKLDLPAIALAADAAGTAWSGSPFPGLEAFQPWHREVFFGRDKAREEALKRLRSAAGGEFAFLLIHGRSGSGKSSLVRAGLVGDVAIQAAEADKWRNCILSPGLGGSDPLPNLITALADALPEAATLFDGTPSNLAGVVRQALAAVGRSKSCKLLLVIDQLEELLVGDSSEQREVFAETIAALAACGAVWVVATLRSDLLARIKDSPALSRLCSDDRMYWLERPSRTELRDIIRRPAAAARLRLEGCDPSSQALAEVLVNAAAAAPDSLPLLQFVLARMFAVDGAGGDLTFATYVRLGRLEGAIGQWAENTAQDVIASGIAEGVIDQVILDLGRLEPETGAVVARLSDADSVSSDRQEVLEALRRARLVTLDDEGRTRVAHEAVLTHWTRADALFKSHQRDIGLRDLVETEAAKWQQEHRSAAFLIPAGPRVAETESLLKAARVTLSPLARGFADASIACAQKAAAEEARQRIATAHAQRRRTQMAIAAAAVMAVLALIAGASGWNWRKATETAQRNEQTVIAQRNAAINGRVQMFGAMASQFNQLDDFGTGLALALDAISDLRKFGMPVPGQLQRELFIARNELRERQTFHETSRGRQALPGVPALSPDGQFLAGCTDREFIVVDVHSKQRVGAAPARGDMANCTAAFSPDGTRVAFAQLNNIYEFDPTLATRIFEIPNDSSSATVLIAFTSDGAYLVAFRSDATAFLDPSTGKTLWSTPRGLTPPIVEILSCHGALSADSTLLVRAVGSSAEIWDIATRTRIHSLDNPLPISAVAVSPDNAHMVAASDDGIARVWDLATGQISFTLTGPTAGLTCASYSPDGSRILTCSKDGMLTSGADHGLRFLLSRHDSPETVDKVHLPVVGDPDRGFPVDVSDDFINQG